MSSTFDPRTGVSGQRSEARDERGTYEEYRAYEDYGTVGSTAAAGWLMLLGGFWSFFMGLSLVLSTNYYRSLPAYSTLTHYTYHWDLHSWGWATLGLGIATVAVAVCVLLRMEWARWAGIFLVSLSAIGSFMFLPFYPFWSILVLAVDAFIIWALATARQRREA